MFETELNFRRNWWRLFLFSSINFCVKCFELSNRGVVIIQRGLKIAVKPKFDSGHKYCLVTFIADVFQAGCFLGHEFIIHHIDMDEIKIKSWFLPTSCFQTAIFMLYFTQ